MTESAKSYGYHAPVYREIPHLVKLESEVRFLLFAFTLIALSVQAQDYSRSAAPNAREVPKYVLGSGHERWTGGQINWSYNPGNQPSNLSTSEVIEAINTATARWAGMCDLTFTYLGTTSAAPNVRSTFDTIDRVNVIGWGQLTNEMASYGAYTAWWYDGTHAMMDADVVINTAYQWTIQDVKAIMTHEIGHVIGLKHSEVQRSVMFANPYNSYSFQRTLRGDDANACAALYGVSVNAESNRALNWAEEAYPQYFLPSPAASATNSGYHYRYYPATNTYVGTRDGSAYMMGADNIIRRQGDLSNFTSLVHGAGF